MTRRDRRPGCAACAAALLAILGLAACGARPPAPAAPMTLQAAAAPAQPAFLLRPGDLVTIKFYHNPELNEDVLIRPDGMISLQIIGDVRAADVSPADLARTLDQKYSGELATPKVSVIVRSLPSQRVYVGGEVGKQGVVPLNAGLTAFQAIQEAGGFQTTAHRKQVILIRRAEDGHPTGYAVDLRPVASGEHPEQDVMLAPYDIVFVPRSKIANVNLFVEQYIRNNLPISPGFSVAPY